jgi:hypothetical protein
MRSGVLALDFMEFFSIKQTFRSVFLSVSSAFSLEIQFVHALVEVVFFKVCQRKNKQNFGIFFSVRQSLHSHGQLFLRLSQANPNR